MKVAAPNSAATAGSSPPAGSGVVVGGGAVDVGGSALVEHVASTGNGTRLVNEALMKLVSSPLPHHVALSVHSRKLWRESGTFGRCP